MHRGRCLCGGVTWEVEGPFEWMSHCHCSRCRKAHGAPFATYAAAPAAGFRLSGADLVARWESMPGWYRSFCRICGSVVPGEPADGRVFLPTGNFEDDIGVRPLAHIFTGSKAPWYAIRDALPQFASLPDGFDGPAIADLPPLDPPGAPRGSCLCRGVAFVLEGAPLGSYNCHCTRCRRARSAAHAANLFLAGDGLRFSRGADLVDSYKVPEAERFTQAFCRRCGSAMPFVSPVTGFAVVPMGSLDDDPGMHPQGHIFVASKAPWFEIADALPQYEGYAT